MADRCLVGYQVWHLWFMGARRNSQRFLSKKSASGPISDAIILMTRASGRPTSRMARGCIPPMRRRNIQPPRAFAMTTSGGQCEWAKPNWESRVGRGLTRRVGAGIGSCYGASVITDGSTGNHFGPATISYRRSEHHSHSQDSPAVHTRRQDPSARPCLCRARPPFSSASRYQMGVTVCARTFLLRFRWASPVR